MKITARHGGLSSARARRLAAIALAGGLAAATVASSMPAAQAASPFKPKVATAAQVKAAKAGVATAKYNLKISARAAQRQLRVGKFAAPTDSFAAAAVPAEGSYIRFSNRVYKIVGGAPIWVASWAIYGGAKPTTNVSEATFYSLRPWPKDGTFITASGDHRAYRFVGGAPIWVSTWAAFGGGQASTLIDQANLNAVINNVAGVSDEPFGHILPFPMNFVFSSDGLHYAFDANLFIRAGQSGRVYKIVGGAPQYVASWTPYGGTKAVTVVDQVAIDRASPSLGYDFLQQYPVDGWPVTGTGSSATYGTVGGAPIYIASGATLGTIIEVDAGFPSGWTASKVDNSVILNGGAAFPYNHMLFVPMDGAVATGEPSLTPYIITGGVPAIDPETTDIPWQGIDDVAIQRAGTGGVWNHLRAAPVTK